MGAYRSKVLRRRADDEINKLGLWHNEGPEVDLKLRLGRFYRGDEDAVKLGGERAGGVLARAACIAAA